MKIKYFSFVFQVGVSSYEAASNVVIELDMDTSLFGFPRELVVAGAGEDKKKILHIAIVLEKVKAPNMFSFF